METTIADFQKKIADWHLGVFGDVQNERGQWVQLGQLVEEVGEFSRILTKEACNYRKEDLSSREEELGDIFISLCQLATACEIDLEQVVREKWAKVRQLQDKRDR